MVDSCHVGGKSDTRVVVMAGVTVGMACMAISVAIVYVFMASAGVGISLVFRVVVCC